MCYSKIAQFTKKKEMLVNENIVKEEKIGKHIQLYRQKVMSACNTHIHRNFLFTRGHWSLYFNHNFPSSHTAPGVVPDTRGHWQHQPLVQELAEEAKPQVHKASIC